MRSSISAALVAAVVGAMPGALPRPAAAAAPEAPVALGVNVADPGKPPVLADYVSEVGRNPAIVMWFQSFDEPLYYDNQMHAVEALGAVPMVSWAPARDGQGIPLAQLAAGADDAYLRTAAVAAAAYLKPIFIRFAPEMNIPGNPWGPGVNGNTPADFIAAWRHVVTIFRDADASNVLWVWSPNEDCGGRCPFDAYYPGDSWVSWVALDGYNYGPIDNTPWMSMAQVFGPSYDDLTALTNKPLMIAETASTEEGGNKAAWITNSFMSDLPNRLPRVRAVIWFNRIKETDWRVNSSPTALASYRAVAALPAYQEDPSALLSVGSDPPTSSRPTSLPPTTTTPPTPKPNTAGQPEAKSHMKHTHSSRHRTAHLPRWFRQWVSWRRHGAVARSRPTNVPHRVPRWAWKRLLKASP